MTTPYRISLATALAGIAVAAAAASDLAAQRRGSAERPARTANPIERVIRLADELELTAEQRGQLDAIRTEVLERRAARAAELMTLRSEVAAGMREPEGVRQELAERWREEREGMESVRGRMNAVLTDAQREQLQEMNRQALRRHARGRADVGIRGQRGRPDGASRRGLGGRSGRGSANQGRNGWRRGAGR